MKLSLGSSGYCIHLELEPYLRQWLIHDCGGEMPVRFGRLSIENRILYAYLTRQPANAAPDGPTEETVPVVIPCFRDKPPSTYNHLPQKARHTLKEAIRNRFLIELWTDLHRFGHIGKRRDHLIMAWMEAHGITVDDTNYNTLAKIYQRQHRAYLERERRQKTEAAKKSGKK